MTITAIGLLVERKGERRESSDERAVWLASAQATQYEWPMVEARTTRRLAAILAADVVGYSRMIASDEAGTLAALKRHRETVFDPAVAQHGGRIVKLMGDGTLVEFGSVVDAVNCSLNIQRVIASETAVAPKIVLRIGVNLGDIVIDGDDIYGDGVNVAARLEPLAEPGGVCIASIVNDSIGGRIDIAFRDGGEVEVKNIDRPIRIWKWHPTNSAGERPTPTAKPAQETPSIAVLPFANMSGDPEQEYFSDGITEDIITDLSKVAGLLVIARNSTFAYKGRQLDMRTIAAELHVGSVLEGSIRRVGNRVRITAQLIDAGSGGHLWAERYDRDLTDIFAVQDEVTQQIVAALRVALTPSERARLMGSGTSDLEAYDLCMRGNALLLGSTQNPEVFERMIGFYRQATERDPNYATAYAALGIAYMQDYLNRWTTDPDHSLVEAGAIAQHAVKLNTNLAVAHYLVGMVARFTKDVVQWRKEIELTLMLNPNYGYAYGDLGLMEIYAGNSLAAIPLIERAMRLDPAFNHQNIHFLGTAYLFAGRYENAALLFKERIMMVPGTDLSRAFLAAALGHLGEIDEASRVWRELKAINPKYSFSEHVGRLPFRNQADVDRIREGLTKAGLPD